MGAPPLKREAAKSIAVNTEFVAGAKDVAEDTWLFPTLESVPTSAASDVL